MFKSTCKKISQIDYNKQFTITRLFADPQMIQIHRERLLKILPNPTETDLRKHVDSIIVKENVFNAIMEYIVTCFSFQLDKEEVQLFKTRFAQQFPQSFDDNVLTDIASKLISKGLVFQVLANENGIVVSDDEAKQYLDNYYKATNNSINEFLSNPEKFNEIKSVILEEKITQWLLGKFKVNLDLQQPEQNNQPNVAQQNSNLNSNQSRPTPSPQMNVRPNQMGPNRPNTNPSTPNQNSNPNSNKNPFQK